jgi:hypothetical protein
MAQRGHLSQRSNNEVSGTSLRISVREKNPYGETLIDDARFFQVEPTLLEEL